MGRGRIRAATLRRPNPSPDHLSIRRPLAPGKDSQYTATAPPCQTPPSGDKAPSLERSAGPSSGSSRHATQRHYIGPPSVCKSGRFRKAHAIAVHPCAGVPGSNRWRPRLRAPRQDAFPVARPPGLAILTGDSPPFRGKRLCHNTEPNRAPLRLSGRAGSSSDTSTPSQVRPPTRLAASRRRARTGAAAARQPGSTIGGAQPFVIRYEDRWSRARLRLAAERDWDGAGLAVTVAPRPGSDQPT